MSATDLPSWPLYQGVQGSEVKRWAHFNKVTFFFLVWLPPSVLPSPLLYSLLSLSLPW